MKPSIRLVRETVETAACLLTGLELADTEAAVRHCTGTLPSGRPRGQPRHDARDGGSAQEIRSCYSGGGEKVYQAYSA
jgi:hypothetical protein